MKLKHISRFVGPAVLTIAALVLASCSGGSGTSSPSTATPVIMMGAVLKDGGVTVNGVAFDTGSATVTDDNAAKDPGFLDNGMIVKLKGRINDDRLNGVADRIKVIAEVRGEIISIGTDSFTIL